MKILPSDFNFLLRAMAIYGFCFDAVGGVNDEQKVDATKLYDFLACQSQETGKVKVWCHTLVEETQVQFVDCMNACNYAESWVHPSDNTVMAVEAYGPPAFEYDCFLDCFFAQETAIYRTEPASDDNLAGFLDGTVTCADYGDTAYCQVIAVKDKRADFAKCLSQGNMTVSYLPTDPDVFRVDSMEGSLSQSDHFRQCFFSEKRGAAMLKPKQEALEQCSFTSELFKHKEPSESYVLIKPDANISTSTRAM